VFHLDSLSGAAIRRTLKQKPRRAGAAGIKPWTGSSFARGYPLVDAALAAAPRYMMRVYHLVLPYLGDFFGLVKNKYA
jgi:hypothetical protein